MIKKIKNYFVSLFNIVYQLLYNMPFLVQSGHSWEVKLRIFMIWLKINFKYAFFCKLFKLESENIFGFHVRSYDYGSIRFLFDNIFFRNEYFFHSISHKPVIFDCGANIGMATIFFKWIYPESEIYAFEPDKKTFELLKSNIEDNGLKNVHFFNVALSDKEGEIDFFIDSEERGSLLMSAKYERMPKDRITVDAISLSSFIKTKGLKQIDYIKMDIEGSEGEVMADLDKSGLLHLVDILTIEYHHKIGSGKSSLSQFLGILESNNYEYQVNAYCSPVSAKNKFQDVLFYIYRFSFN